MIKICKIALLIWTVMPIVYRLYASAAWTGLDWTASCIKLVTAAALIKGGVLKLPNNLSRSGLLN